MPAAIVLPLQNVPEHELVCRIKAGSHSLQFRVRRQDVQVIRYMVADMVAFDRFRGIAVHHPAPFLHGFVVNSRDVPAGVIRGGEVAGLIREGTIQPNEEGGFVVILSAPGRVQRGGFCGHRVNLSRLVYQVILCVSFQVGGIRPADKAVSASCQSQFLRRRQPDFLSFGMPRRKHGFRGISARLVQRQPDARHLLRGFQR